MSHTLLKLIKIYLIKLNYFKIMGRLAGKKEKEKLIVHTMTIRSVYYYINYMLH